MTPPSARLAALRSEAVAGPVSLAALAERLGPAATGTLLLLCGLAGLVPGLAVVLAIPLCLLAAGLLLGRTQAWLPGPVRNRRIQGDRLAGAIDRLLPHLHRLERHIRPRLAWATGRAARRVVGLAALVCGVLIVLPVPFGNTAPALAVIVLAVGLLAGDGAAVFAGLGLAAAALILDALLLAAGYEAILAIVALFA